MSEPSAAVESPWETVGRVMAEVRALNGVLNLLSWDQETYMPPRGAVGRGEQLAAIEGAVHDRLTSPALQEALSVLEAAPGAEPERALVLRELRRDVARAVAVPGDLVRAIARAQAEGHVAWTAAREEARFQLFAPALARLLHLRREQAAALGPVLEREGASSAPVESYDALLDLSEPGMRVARLEPLFGSLQSWLVPLFDRIVARPPPEDGFFRGRFEDAAQWKFTLELLELIGFDLKAGRQDRSVHPLTAGLDPGDVRVTTRVYEDRPLSAIFSTLHEGGHGLYEQGLPTVERRSVLGTASSFGLHESQSRLWENQVGRSLAFWRGALPRLSRHFPKLEEVPVERFFRAVNRVERSLVRVDADEVSYNLHIVLRFEVELALVRGSLGVADLPSAWNEGSARLLGLRPPSDLLGVLQDIHWSWGLFGYFPTYALGNLYAASLFAAARRALPGLEEAIAGGQFIPLRDWLRRNVHEIGRRRTAEEIVRDAAGTGLSDADFRAYLERKYLEELA